MKKTLFVSAMLCFCMIYLSACSVHSGRQSDAYHYDSYGQIKPETNNANQDTEGSDQELTQAIENEKEDSEEDSKEVSEEFAEEDSEAEQQNMDEDNRIFEKKLGYSYGDMEYIGERSFQKLKKAYELVDFSSNFMRGDPEQDRLYRKEYLSMLAMERKVWDPEIQEEIYLDQLRRNETWDITIEKIPDYEYYYFDIDGDGLSELLVSDRFSFVYFFKYDVVNDKIVLWKETGHAWYYVYGTRAMLWDRVGTGRWVQFLQLDEQGGDAVDAGFLEQHFLNRENNEEEVAYLIIWPIFSEPNPDAVLEEETKKEGYYREEADEYYFRVTEAQFNEIMEPFYTESADLLKRREEVMYTYEELLAMD